jgi:endonuclease III
MDEKTRKIRTKRVEKLNAVLNSLYPDAKIALNYSNDFECLVAVELSAQCTDRRVNEVTALLFKKYPTIDAFACAKQKAMEKDVFSCGFYRNKARNIIAAAKMVRDDYNGELPRTLSEMIKIPGAARKTANVVLSTLYGIHEGIAVDTHVRRFAIRFDLTDHVDPRRIEKDLMEIMPTDQWWGFNHRLVHYGRTICKAHKHDCTQHPLTLVYPKANEIWPKSA